MFNLKTLKKTEKTLLEVEIERLLAQMANEQDTTSNSYAAQADQLVKLYKLKEVDSKKRVSPDNLAALATNIVGILLVLNYEHAHVMTSKAINFVGKKIIS